MRYKFMKRLIAISAVLALIISSLCACSCGGSTDTSGMINIDATEDDTASPDDILSWQININGVDFKVPFNSSEIGKLGYEYKTEGSVEAKKYSIGVYPQDKDGNNLSSQLWNPTDSPQPYANCLIGEIKIGLGDEKLKAILPGGFKFDDSVTADSIKKQYGKPDSEVKGKNYVMLKYSKSAFRYVEFFLYTDKKMRKYSSVAIENFS